MLPNLKSLVVFEAVARLRSFSKAAQELHVSQPAISYQIKALEEYFDVCLIDRSGPKLAPSYEGELLCQDLSDAIQLMQRGVSRLRASLSSQAIGISVRSHFAYKWLSPNLDDGNFDFDIRFLHSNDSVDFLNPNVDVSIEWLHHSEVTSDAIFLLAGNLTPACHPELLVGIDDPSDVAHLRRAVLLQEADTRAWDEWLEKAGHAELRPLRNEYYGDTNVRQHAAVERRGFALISPLLMAEEISAGTLVCPFLVQLDTFAYYLRVPEDRRRKRNVRAFVEWITRRFVTNPAARRELEPL